MYSFKLVVLLLASFLVNCQCFPGTTGQGHYEPTDTGFGWLCRVMCSRNDAMCPLECQFSYLDMYKRSNWTNRDRRLGDFSFDDYLFMTLLGRNLDDQN